MARIPLFGLLSPRSPMLGLIKHYDCIAKGMKLVEESLECYVLSDTSNECREFRTLLEEVNAFEEEADSIKRSIRNHLPSWLFMPVDRTLFFTYTRQQDNILDEGQKALQWLSMRQFVIPELLQKELIYYIADVHKTVQMLSPALVSTVELINGDGMDREYTKQLCRNVREQHKNVSKKKAPLVSNMYNFEGLEFKSVYQLMRFTSTMYHISHNAEGCADMLRAMIAK